MNYPKAIRIARSIADITQKELAIRSGLDRSYLSLIESDRRRPTIETIQSISDALGMPFHLLTLLGTEKSDLRRFNEDQVLGLAKQLTSLLLEDQDNHDGEGPGQTSGGKPERSGVSPRGPKRRSKKAA